MKNTKELLGKAGASRQKLFRFFTFFMLFTWLALGTLGAQRPANAPATRTVLFVGESGGNTGGMRAAAARLNELWKDEAKAFHIDDYYTKGHADQNAYVTKTLGIPANEIGGHANILDTSEMLFVNPKHIRKNKIAPGGGYQNSGVSGDPTKATAEIGRMGIEFKVNAGLSQYRALKTPGRDDRGGG